MALLLIGLASDCLAEEKPVFGAVENTPPYVFEKDGRLTGIAIDIFAEIQKRANFSAVVEALPAKRMIRLGTSGVNDGFLQIYFDESRKSVFYSSIPGYSSPHCIFIKKGNEQYFAGSRLENLNGKKVGWNRGYRLTPEMAEAVQNNKFFLEVTGKTEQNLKKLVSGRIDCYINNYFATLFVIKNMNLQESISFLPAPFYPSKGTYIAIAKKGKRITDKQLFMKNLNQALESIYKDGTADRIIKKYIN